MQKAKIKRRDHIDAVRVALWYSYIRENLSKNSDYQIERIIEPEAFGKNEYGDAYHNNKWRGYRVGKHTPNQKLINAAESHVFGSCKVINNILWQVIRGHKEIDWLIKHGISQLSWAVQRILYKPNKYDASLELIPDLSRKELIRLERLAGLDALAAQVIFFKLAAHRDGNTFAISQSIYRTLLIICTEIPFFYYREHLISLVNFYVFSSVSSTKEIFGENFEDSFSKNVKILLDLLLAMEDKMIVGITRKERVRVLSDLLHETRVLSLLDGGYFLTLDALWDASNANYL
ncbi:hypothetical protein [Acinetobacter radioresistens]|uniref:hypothetical protein n=1 Tax=Acinetobacter radioresistens TaxID=40216 RepID=UPI000DACE932|nr:hypothetical protein [Acinetobacter radioresistens]AWV87254.1 hypothetical protein DOM24_11900 [Acinetobacter radioresistens]MCX0328056.1 hypothetical protein [Acinetobacter radioresistens]